MQHAAHLVSCRVFCSESELQSHSYSSGCNRYRPCAVASIVPLIRTQTTTQTSATLRIQQQGSIATCQQAVGCRRLQLHKAASFLLPLSISWQLRALIVTERPASVALVKVQETLH